MLFNSTEPTELTAVLNLLNRVVAACGSSRLHLCADKIAASNEEIIRLRNKRTVEPEALEQLEKELAKIHVEKEQTENLLQQKNDTLRKVNHELHGCTREVIKHGETLGELKATKAELDDERAKNRTIQSRRPLDYLYACSLRLAQRY